MKKGSMFCIIICLFTAYQSYAAPIEITQSGNLQFKSSYNKLEWFLFSTQKPLCRIRKHNFSGELEGDALKKTLKGTWHSTCGKIKVKMVLERINTENYRYITNFDSEEPIQADILAPTLYIPTSSRSGVLLVDGKELILPAEFNKLVLWEQIEIQSRELCFSAGDRNITIKGNFGLRIQDDRKFKQDFYTVRFIFPQKGSISTNEYELNIKVSSTVFKQIDLRHAVNMGFVDETADDNKGGWTDQGAKNDLRKIKSGLQEFAGVEYAIINLEKNKGRSCIVVSNPRFRRYPAHSPVTLSANTDGKYLYLLHAAAWPPKNGKPVGTIRITYDDDSVKDIPVVNGTDCGNWWRPANLDNAKVAFSYDSNGETIGLYSSAFPLDNKPLKTIEFLFAEHTVWMVVAATISDNQVLMPQPQSYVIEAGKDWSRLDTTEQIITGSPLDLSGWLDAPAGKNGRIIIKDGHFYFERKPEQRIRFVGINICNQHCFMPHDKIDRMIDRICKMGYNSVRLHHIDRKLIDPGADNTFTFDPQRLDELNYLFSKCKEAGLYISIDLYSLRAIKPGDGIREISSSHLGHELKALIPISADAMNSWKRYSKLLLTQVNPYTGMTWSADPALYSLNLVNEGSLPATYSRFPNLMEVLDNAYKKDLNERELYSDKLFKERSKDFQDFLVRKEYLALKEMIRFTRDELHFKGAITNYNFNSRLYQLPLREQLDIIDNHSYLDHPTYPRNQWKLPAYFRQVSSLEEFGRVPAFLGSSREFGKPYILTEVQFCNPNKYRSEAGTLFAAVIALQNYDGYYRFSYADSFEWREPRFFAVDNEPISQLTEKMIHFLFGRGDIAAAVPAVAMTWDDAWLKKQSSLKEEFPEDFYPLALYGRIGNLRAGRVVANVVPLPIGNDWEKSLPANFKEAMVNIRKGNTITSSTGEIQSYPQANQIKIITPLSEAFSLPEGKMTGKFMNISGVDTFTTVSIHSLDKLSLGQSKKMLLFHVSNTAATGMKFYSEKCNLLEEWGKLPLLVKNSKIRIRLNLDSPEKVKIEVLNWNGTVKKAIDTFINNGGLEFDADTHGGNMIYYISQQ